MLRLLLLLRTAGCLLALLIATRAGAGTLDLQTATIADLDAAYATGKLTAVKVTRAYLARIAAYDKKGPAINAVITLNPKAIAEAKALDAERRRGKLRGPLHGVPIGGRWRAACTMSRPHSAP